jgi:hypothetical protein
MSSSFSSSLFLATSSFDKSRPTSYRWISSNIFIEYCNKIYKYGRYQVNKIPKVHLANNLLDVWQDICQPSCDEIYEPLQGVWSSIWKHPHEKLFKLFKCDLTCLLQLEKCCNQVSDSQYAPQKRQDGERSSCHNLAVSCHGPTFNISSFISSKYNFKDSFPTYLCMEPSESCYIPCGGRVHDTYCWLLLNIISIINSVKLEWILKLIHYNILRLLYFS